MRKLAAYTDELPSGDELVALEETADGWRGLTSVGEVLNVAGANGHRPQMPQGDVLIVRGELAESRRQIRADAPRVDEYLRHYDRGVELARADRNNEALAAFEGAIEVAPTAFARFNRALVLLALGRWREGFAEYFEVELHKPFMRPPVAAALERGLKPWRGEDLDGSPLLVMHAHGLGDSIMALRFLPRLAQRGIKVELEVPDELRGLTGCVSRPGRVSYFCPLLHLIGVLGIGPGQVAPIPYISIDRQHVESWRKRLGPGPHIGLAWLPGAKPVTGDYPRAIPLHLLVEALSDQATLHSVQHGGVDEAQSLGVATYQFAELADCAAAMLAMDRVVAIDTCALHLAGAIGHRRVDGLLSSWASWRWRAPWYVANLCRQPAPGDWEGALAQLRQ